MQNKLRYCEKKVDNRAKIRLFAIQKVKKTSSFPVCLTEGWQSGQMQRTVNPSTFVYDGSNPSPSTS